MLTRFAPRLLAGAGAAIVSLATLAPAASAQSYRPEMTVIRAGKVITVAGREIDNGEIVIEDGEITLVGVALEVPSYATVIEARDQTVMPGLIHAGTRAGLDNYRRTGINADKLAASDVMPDRYDFEPWLRAGFSAVAFLPPGDNIPGRASVFRTGGPSDSQILRRRGYIRVSFTDLPGDKRTLTTAITRARAEIKKVEDARAQWDREQAERRRAEQQQQQQNPEGGEGGSGQRARPAAAEAQNGNAGNNAQPAEAPTFTPPEIEPTLQPFVDLLQQREGVLMVLEFVQAAGLPHLDDALATALRPDPPPQAQPQQGRRGQQPQQPQRGGAQQQQRGQGGQAPAAPPANAFKPPETLAHAIRLTRLDRGFNWDRVTFFGSPAMWSDYTHIVDELASRGVPIILTPDMVFLPQTVTRYNLAGELADRGAELIFVPRFEGGFGPELFLNQLAVLVREGLSREAALAGVTRNPARLLGISARVGTIERGKQADLVFLSGDPLDPHSRVTRVMIAGQTAWERDGDHR